MWISFLRISGRGSLALAAVLLALSLVGCSDQVRLHPVQGVVVWSDGQPARELAGGAVSLRMEGDAERKTRPNGGIQPDGTFTLSAHPASGKVLPKASIAPS